MIRNAALIGLVLVASSGGVARAQSAPPQAYVLKAEGALGDRKTTLTILRDGARERVELAIAGAGVMTSLYDFEAHRVYWIGWSRDVPCTSGRYLSPRAPVGEDPVTGTADNLIALTKGRSRKAAGSGAVAGRAARIEALVGGKRPKDPEEPWPTRVWLAEDGGYLLKLEGEGPKGKPVTLSEVTQLTFGKPPGAPLKPPSECLATNSEMDDAGNIRSSAQATVDVQASATTDLASGATSATVTQAEKPRAAGALAKLAGVTLTAVEQPDEGPCGRRLQLTGGLTVDGPATIKVQFYPSVSGLRFPDGGDVMVTVDAAGSTTLVRDALFPRSLKGQLRLRAIVQGTKGRNGPMVISDPVPFEVTCQGTR